MRTTINLADEVLAICKIKAREKGVTLGEVISEAVLAFYRDSPTIEHSTRYDLPVAGEGGLQPGVDLDNRIALEDLMEDRL